MYKQAWQGCTVLLSGFSYTVSAPSPAFLKKQNQPCTYPARSCKTPLFSHLLVCCSLSLPDQHLPCMRTTQHAQHGLMATFYMLVSKHIVAMLHTALCMGTQPRYAYRVCLTIHGLHSHGHSVLHQLTYDLCSRADCCRKLVQKLLGWKCTRRLRVPLQRHALWRSSFSCMEKSMLLLSAPLQR